MQGALLLESDLSTGSTLFILSLVSRFRNGGKSGEMRTLGSHGLPWVPRVPIRWMKRLGFGTHVAMDTCSPARQASEAACKQFAWKCIIVNHGVFMSTVLQVFSPTSWRSTWLMETEPSFVRRHLRRRCSLLNPFESTMAVTMVSLNYPGLETHLTSSDVKWVMWALM